MESTSSTRPCQPHDSTARLTAAALTPNLKIRTSLPPLGALLGGAAAARGAPKPLPLLGMSQPEGIVGGAVLLLLSASLLVDVLLLLLCCFCLAALLLDTLVDAGLPFDRDV